MLAVLASASKQKRPSLAAVTPPLPRRTGRPGRHRKPVRAILLLPLLVALLWSLDAVGASPASADAARPTNFESLIDSVEPRVDGLSVEVVGGDSFLEVRAAKGTEVEIPGYDGEPYLRIRADGTVQRNERSPATYLNLDRFGSGVRLPDDVSSRAEPRWVDVGDGGVVAFHDHRIHWMATQTPPVGDDRFVQAWTVPLVVDGDRVQVTGRLLLHPDVFPWPALLTVAAAVGAMTLARRAGPRAALVAGASGLALVIAVSELLINPADSGASPIPVVLAALPLVLVVAGRFAAPHARHMVLPLASVAALAGWVVGRIGVYWMPMVPTALPVWLDRVGTALVAGVAIGVACAVLLRPVPEARSVPQMSTDA